ncbi:MAG: hypothetical protein AB7P02_12650 [Alphaproteobacteria bacterium]
MSDVTTGKMTDTLVPSPGAREVVAIQHSIAVASGYASSGDDVIFFKAPCAMRIVGGGLNHAGTLGASATAQLKAGSTAITAASTAGGASTVLMNVFPVDVAKGDPIQARIAGANITASTTVKVFILGHRL